MYKYKITKFLLTNILIVLILAIFSVASLFAKSNEEKKVNDDKPNILFILADDLGIEGISAYGSDSFKTPNIDRIADEGIMFTHAFANPYCTPSRSELLTGKYPFATNTPRVIWDYDLHGDMILDVSEPSFARQLQQSGYSTAIAGKWQLSFLVHQDWVHEFGFDTYMLWQIVGEDSQRTTRFHAPYYRKDGRILSDEISDRYGPDVLVDYLIDFMESSHKEGPFMAYYTALLPHFPWVPTPDSEDQTMPEHDGVGNFMGDPKFFPDMVHRLDYNVGRLIDALDEIGIADNTILIFLSDNGTDQQLSASINGKEISGGKATLTDRGTLVPMLIRWPGNTNPGSIDDELVELADFFPTFIELANAEMPTVELHGKSFANRLKNKNESIKPWVHLQMADDRYLRSLDWIVTNKNVYQKVQPYPTDPEYIEIQNLNEEEVNLLNQLGTDLYDLVEKPTGEESSSGKQGFLLPVQEADLQGNWNQSVIFDPNFGINSYNEHSAKGEATASFTTKLPKSDIYDVQIAYSSHKNRSTNVTISISQADSKTDLEINQQRHPNIKNKYKSIGKFLFNKNELVSIEIKNKSTKKYMMIDGVRLVPSFEL